MLKATLMRDNLGRVLALLLAGVACEPLFAQSPTGPMMVLQSRIDQSEPPSAPWSPPADSVMPYPATDGTPSPVDELPSPVPQPMSSGTGESGVRLPDGRVFSDDALWHSPTQWFGATPWDLGVELGINGSSGTDNTMSMRVGGSLKRESRFSKIDFSTYYNRTASDGLVTQNNATLNFKNDWLLDDSVPWTLFAKVDGFYDKFQAYDEQANIDSGVGYRFWHEPAINLTGRVGAGGSREFGGPNTDWTPEGLLGFDYDQKITSAHKLCCKIEYYPDFEDFNQYRIVSEASWEVALVQPSNLSLKISATDRYDSTPDGAKPNLLNYSILMLLKL
jgi:putative salt-induced outer membrane protein YdiY